MSFNPENRARRALRGRAPAALITFMFLAAACGGDDEAGSATEEPATSSATAAQGSDAAEVLHVDDCEAYEADAGIDEQEIRIGTSSPRSGPFVFLSGVSKGAEAYFRYNAEEGGGIPGSGEGRTVEVISKDDQYDPSKTRANVEELLQQDDVFALFSVVGTAPNLAFWDMTDAACVPNLFASAGAPAFGDEAQHPWTVGSLPTYPTEAAVYAEYLRSQTDVKTVAILAQNDDFGNAYVDAFEAAAGDDLEIVARETYQVTDAAVDAQITTLAASGADAFFGAMTGLACPRALDAIERAGWQPVIYISLTCGVRTLLGVAAPTATHGVLSTQFMMDPADPNWAEVEAMTLYHDRASRYGEGGLDTSDATVAAGWTFSDALAQVLASADGLTRADVMFAARNLDGMSAGLLLPGITLRTGPGDPYPVESLQMVRYDSQRALFDLIDPQGNVLPPGATEPFDFEGRAGEFTGGS